MSKTVFPMVNFQANNSVSAFDNRPSCPLLAASRPCRRAGDGPLLSFELPLSTSAILVARLLFDTHATFSRIGPIKNRGPSLPVRQSLIAPTGFDCDESEALCKPRHLLGGRCDLSRVAVAPVHIFAIVRELFLRRHREYDHPQPVERVVVDV